MTPLICKSVLGAVVPINAMGIVVSTIQVVLAPIFLGVGVNTFANGVAVAVTPYTPVIGVVATVLLVGASVAKVAPMILAAGMPLQLACLNLHLAGGIIGYVAMLAIGYDKKTCRTVAIETAMKSSAFGFLLASQHFGAFNARVPAAVSVVWMAITGSIMAVYWKFKPIEKTGATALSENPNEDFKASTSGGLIAGLSAFATFMLAAVGLKKYRSFKTPVAGLQEPLTTTSV
jgi:BASS family bile acid:Na+ symporter